MKTNQQPEQPWKMLLYALGMVIALLLILGIVGHFERVLIN